MFAFIISLFWLHILFKEYIYNLLINLCGITDSQNTSTLMICSFLSILIINMFYIKQIIWNMNINACLDDNDVILTSLLTTLSEAQAISPLNTFFCTTVFFFFCEKKKKKIKTKHT